LFYIIIKKKPRQIINRVKSRSFSNLYEKDIAKLVLWYVNVNSIINNDELIIHQYFNDISFLNASSEEKKENQRYIYTNITF
jgi:hypothetical protein